MKVTNQILLSLFVLFIGGVSLTYVFTEDRAFSETENRVLAQMPTFTWDKFIAGKFTKEFETYLSDQFVKKDFWTGLKAVTEKVSLKKENNGIYFGKDGYLFERFPEPGKQFTANINHLNLFSDKLQGLNLYVMTAPTSIAMYPEKLPKYAYSADQLTALNTMKEQLNPSIHWIDIYKPLEDAKDEPLYYHTDHHWTTHGAFIAYEEAAKAMGLQAYTKEDFTIDQVSNKFYGTYDAKANDFTVTPDSIELYKPNFDIEYTVEFGDDTKNLDGLYAWEFLKKRDQYAMFLNGNHGKVVIHSTNKNGRKLLVVKDSYAHALIPFLANHFEEIHMIDLRYTHEKLDHYMEQQDIQDALVVYNISTFADDPNIIWLRQ
ncbi:hypothetical protein H9649_06135 [Sporosarcina sp. Sa2YVA2]|uniref:DHHW protein n=1 Tax=Sporosarcina quadrami TaxID=2762234 RepID=A0ABR8U7Z9_9BACL|nr:DHHW family protein [Sporosarcina quadrami]MBD7984152.1 hypothetical protein [Sporosarcina quadrami]